MENENTNEKKKQKIMLLIGLVTLLIAALGATYAYFQISTNTESSNTNITGSTPDKSLVTLKDVTTNLHLNISASDMSYENRTKEYYATDVEAKSYEDNESDGTKTIAEVELKGGEATTKYSCTAKLTVSKVTEPDEDKDTMVDVLQPGDMILQFKGNIISEKLDLSELKTSGSKEYNLSFKVTGNKIESIQAYIKLVNKETQQNYLSGKKLNIDISTSDLKCEVALPDPKIGYLRSKSAGKLTEDLVYGLYRYQGNSIISNYNSDERTFDREDTVNNNYICLGSDCSSAESNDMYRIIGINEDGEIKVIKNTPAKGNVLWGDRWSDTQWPNSNMYSYLNTDFYQTLPVELKEKIVNVTWNYGDVTDPDYNKQNIFTPEELAKYNELTDAIRGWDDSELNDDQRREKIKEVTKMYSEALVKRENELTDNVKANIGLMNITDYCSSFESNGTYNCYTSWYYDSFDEAKNEDFGVTWLTPKNEWNNEGWEWTITRVGYQSGWATWNVDYFGYVVGCDNNVDIAARPVFFLTSDIELSGEGTIENPFRVAGIE